MLDFLNGLKGEKNEEYYLFAHNGAKYDICIVNNILFNDERFSICNDGFLELNGGIIN